MCRNIVPLNNLAPAATDEECHDAALQYVRKIAGTTKPSKVNQEVFDRAVEEIAHATRHLRAGLVTTAPPKSREEEAAKRQARSADRYEALRAFQQEKRAAQMRASTAERLSSAGWVSQRQQIVHIPITAAMQAVAGGKQVRQPAPSQQQPQGGADAGTPPTEAPAGSNP